MSTFCGSNKQFDCHRSHILDVEGTKLLLITNVLGNIDRQYFQDVALASGSQYFTGCGWKEQHHCTYVLKERAKVVVSQINGR